MTNGYAKLTSVLVLLHEAKTQAVKITANIKISFFIITVSFHSIPLFSLKLITVGN